MYELPEVEIYTDERRAELLLNNAMTREEWDEIAADVRGWGLDPARLAEVDQALRETLPTRLEWFEEVRRARESAWNRRSA